MAERRRKAAVRNLAAEDAPLVPVGALAVTLLDLAAPDDRAPGRPIVHVARDGGRLDALAAVLRVLAPAAEVAVFPEWDCLPFDHASPSRAVMGQRAAVLRRLSTDEPPDFVLTTGPALAQRVPPPEAWTDAEVSLHVGDPIDVERVSAALIRLGYVFDERVDEPGEAAVRGRTLEVFLADAPLPCRVEHAEGHVTAIRTYDPISQRSVREVSALLVGPASEIVLPPGSEEEVRAFSGQEHELARFYSRLADPLEYLGQADLVVEEGTEARVSAFFEQVAEGRAGKRTPAAESRLYLTQEAWREAVAAQTLTAATRQAAEEVALPDFAAEKRPGAAFAEALKARLKARLKAGDRVVLAGPRYPLRRLVRETAGIADRPVRLIDAWAEVAEASPGEVLAIQAPLDEGFRARGATVFAAADLYGPDAAPVGMAHRTLVFGEVDLRPGDVAVDRDRGLCVFEGLERVETAGEPATEALRLRFAGEDTLMVPVAQADRIWRYGSEPEAVTLDKLDGGTWARRRLEAEATLARTAQHMLGLARERQAAGARPIRPPAREMERFAAGFGFPPTHDQAAAVEAMLADLASGEPMDRLVCGDVGFGKTEVALRALAAAVFAGRQAVLIAPTTVLARQHAETLRRRFARFGIEVAQLSRLVPPKEARRVKQGLADGSVRLAVGTHALAGRGVAYADLGLTVIDEEQRFGARTKADLRRLAGGGHVLTLTATPIPRTLQAALAGLQSLSVLATPPALRQPVRTLVAPFDGVRVRDALEREHRRGGQSFVVCPRIEDIAPMAERLHTLVPGLEVVVAHGGLKAAEMDEAMVRFADGGGDVLLATAIIESGLDVPRANTMLVWEADRFGLAQLHQLRGRVGRGQRRGVVHLLSDPERPPSPAAEQRMRALAAMDRLGAGFAISARDLDLRGAGDLVGEDQAGHAKLVGLGLYRHLLELALRAAKGEPAEDWCPEIAIGLGDGIPEDYVPEPEIRLSLYTRLLRLRGPEAIEALRDEVEDRFGALPEAVEALFAMARLRVDCVRLGVARLTGGPEGVAADLRPGVRPGPMPAADGLVQRDGRVVLRRPAEDETARLALATRLLEHLRKAAERSARI
ncbi:MULTISPECIES: DEAD/DEAH box helicase [Methylobacterium]|uniref:Transcription-repair-coupling factor n=4 Tax=Pseudomonadota TaxID=1224 RepID=A0ABQ4T3Q0_9HYPH|nr:MULTISPECIES: DEAD/DEAH box helicase [Methylobacterium]PIU05703.1 MAG: DEAD/DEAH box helicase [Methylobacterium sp. CG09_land_8_20_14_0_10_71_15]PIU12413.1 MAG: DEAD/DEAH box helicase [Methylobacterium sp. CG08_land_8_20_14_0_20_71_15]GJE08898.1 Transcription-repair-coupling factor [Methylobacterium jeotgali]